MLVSPAAQYVAEWWSQWISCHFWMQPEMQTNDVHSHQWLDIRLLWDHHSCQYLIFTVGWAKNTFVSFLNIWVLVLAKLDQCIIYLSFKKTGNFSIIRPYWHQFCSAAPEPTLFWSTSVFTHRHSHDCTSGPLPLSLSLTKHMVAIGWCPSACAKLHLLCWSVPHLFADSRKWGILVPILDAEGVPAAITDFSAWLFYAPKLGSSALPLLAQLLFLIPSVNKASSFFLKSGKSCSLPSAPVPRSNKQIECKRKTC